MDALKKKRKLFRTGFSRLHNTLLESIKNEDDVILLKANLELLREKHNQLEVLDREIIEVLLNENASTEVLENEVESADEYSGKFKIVEYLVEQAIDKARPKTDTSVNVEKRKFKLPTLEFKKFGGDISDWLPFWGQFKKIHEDPCIDSDDKYQYLLQATIPNTKAREIVESFPPCGRSYEQAIEHLKSRFAKDDLLVEFYIREILKIVITLNSSESKITISSLYDQIESKLRCLETLGVTKEKYAAMLFPLVESCLREDLLIAWQRSRPNSQQDETASESKSRLDSLMNFLKIEVEGEERINLAKQGFGLQKTKVSTGDNTTSSYKRDFASKDKHIKNTRRPTSNVTAAGLVNVKSNTSTVSTDKTKLSMCVFCDGGHLSENCFKARDMSLEERQNILTSKRCCFSCTKVGHLSKHCRAIVKCIICNGKHVPLMCSKLQNNFNRSNIKPKCEEKEAEPNFENSLSNVNGNQVYMQTLVVKAVSDTKELNVRLLFDSGSQRSYIRKSTVEKMKYDTCGEETLLHGLFGGEVTKPRNHACYKVRLQSIDKTYSCNFKALSEINICTYVPALKPGRWTDELMERGIKLFQDADSPIEILIGADIYGKLLTGRKEVLDCGIIALETHLGWVLTGKFQESKEFSSMTALSMFVQSNSICKLWEMDVLGIKDPLQTRSKQEIEHSVQTQFLETVRVNEEGRYEVKLPWSEDHPEVPRNFNLAKKRLENSVKKLTNESLYNVYNNVFSDWLEDGVIEEIPISKWDEGHYLPHRPVIKENSTTAVRPVFDASSKEKGYYSLNQCLEIGINLIEIIPALLLRFRLYKIGVIADIKKAFLQISLYEEDRDFLRFLWQNTDGSLKIFRHRRVVFGVSSSPFLLNAVINYHLQKYLVQCAEDNQFSKCTIEKLFKSFYVDNCVTGVNNERDLKQFISEAIQIFSLGKFELRGWEYTEPGLEDKTEASVLGLTWDKKEDTISVSFHKIVNLEENLVTQRVILSTAHRLFDPIGFTCPISICPKLLLQECWKDNCGWDKEVPEEIKQRFNIWFQELDQLKEMKIPRWLQGVDDVIISVSVHIFCDASKFAYSTAVFMRFELSTCIQLQLIQAKSRVAPVKKMTIPRLELMAATIGARLGSSVVQELRDENKFECNIKFFYWSDSSTVIAWIKREENWGVFVRNRVEEICSLTSRTSWRHIPGTMNPADLPSRGCSVSRLISSRWWEGPSWLKLPEDTWPSNEPEPDEELISLEKKKGPTPSLLSNNYPKDWFYYFSNDFDKIVCVFAWLLRFIHNCNPSKKEKCVSKVLSCKEIIEANNFIIRIVQQQSFEGIRDPKLASLSPFMAADGIIRLKTKLTERKDLENFKFPVVLPSKHDIVDILILTIHKRSCHVGVQGLLSLLRENYWILRGRKTISNTLKKCIPCQRHNSKNVETITPPLPESRVRDAAVFEVVGIDFAGPLFLRDGSKVWICIFTCAVYRAVHLELVKFLSVEAFIDTLRRFIARRGRPSIIYSDNGTNFTGTEKAFKILDWNAILKYSSCQQIDWRFNPPSAAWWGGWWERLIRLMKQLLRKTLGKTSLDYEEMETILCDCESIMNSRPLTYLSETSSDLTAITPNMFLHDLKEIGVPDCDHVNTKSLNKRVRYRQHLREALRKRFRIEYLGQLALKSKKNGRQLKVGELVLIEVENKKRIDWPIGLIEKTIISRDGVCRLVQLKTAFGSLLRPIQRLYPLEMQEETIQEQLKEKIKPKVTKTNEHELHLEEDNVTKENKIVTYLRSGRQIKLPQKFVD